MVRAKQLEPSSRPKKRPGLIRLEFPPKLGPTSVLRYIAQSVPVKASCVQVSGDVSK